MTSHSAAASQGRDPGDLIDRSVLARVLDDVGMENADMLLDVFIEELAGQAQALEAAAAGVDLEAMARAAHQIKGSAATLGAVRLGRLAESIEAAARAKDDAAGAAMADFRGLVQASRQALGQIRHEGLGAPN